MPALLLVSLGIWYLSLRLYIPLAQANVRMSKQSAEGGACRNWSVQACSRMSGSYAFSEPSSQRHRCWGFWARSKE